MDNDQITALAREYAEEYTKKKYPNVPGHVRERIIEGRMEHMEDFIPWLLRRFCLVEKSNVMEIYEKKKRMEDMAGELHKPLMGLWFKAGLKLLEDFFPEIVKEVKE